MDRQPRSRRHWMIWIALCVLLGYPLSLGPVIWIASRFRQPESVFETLQPVYNPFIHLLLASPQPVRDLAGHYLSLGASRGVRALFLDLSREAKVSFCDTKATGIRGW